MIATFVRAGLTPATPEQVSRAYREALLRIVGPVTSQAVAVLHGQGALETGHFKSCWNNNAGNIKAGDKYIGQFTCIKLNEVIGGRTIWFAPEGELDGKDGPITGKHWSVPDGHPQTRMRAYSTLADGVYNKILFLSQAHWRPALELALAGDAFGYVARVRALGYFTAPLEPYQRAVVQLASKYLPVAEATAPVAPPPDPDPAFPEDSPELCHDMATCFRFELPDWLRARLRTQQDDHIQDALERASEDRDRDVAEENQ